MPGPQHTEENMRLMSKADLWRVNNRRLDALTAEIRRDLGYCEQRRRKDYAQLEDICKVRRQRPISPNL